MIEESVWGGIRRLKWCRKDLLPKQGTQWDHLWLSVMVFDRCHFDPLDQNQLTCHNGERVPGSSTLLPQLEVVRIHRILSTNNKQLASWSVLIICQLAQSPLRSLVSLVSLVSLPIRPDSQIYTWKCCWGAERTPHMPHTGIVGGPLSHPVPSWHAVRRSVKGMKDRGKTCQKCIQVQDCTRVYKQNNLPHMVQARPNQKHNKFSRYKAVHPERSRKTLQPPPDAFGLWSTPQYPASPWSLLWRCKRINPFSPQASPQELRIYQ